MADVEAVRIGGDDGPLRKKPRISELPLSSVKRASIDALLHVFKKKGEFDALRKQTYKQFEEEARMVACIHDGSTNLPRDQNRH